MRTGGFSELRQRRRRVEHFGEPELCDLLEEFQRNSECIHSGARVRARGGRHSRTRGRRQRPIHEPSWLNRKAATASFSRAPRATHTFQYASGTRNVSSATRPCSNSSSPESGSSLAEKTGPLNPINRPCARACSCSHFSRLSQR